MMNHSSQSSSFVENAKEQCKGRVFLARSWGLCEKGKHPVEKSNNHMQVNYLITVSRLLIKMKRKELRYKARRRAEAEQPQQNGAESRKNQ